MFVISDMNLVLYFERLPTESMCANYLYFALVVNQRIVVFCGFFSCLLKLKTKSCHGYKNFSSSSESSFRIQYGGLVSSI